MAAPKIHKKITLLPPPFFDIIVDQIIICLFIYFVVVLALLPCHTWLYEKQSNSMYHVLGGFNNSRRRENDCSDLGGAEVSAVTLTPTMRLLYLFDITWGHQLA